LTLGEVSISILNPSNSIARARLFRPFMPPERGQVDFMEPTALAVNATASIYVYGRIAGASAASEA